MHQQFHPAHGTLFPQTTRAFTRWFCTEEKCAAYLALLRWPNGFCCPACGGTTSWPTARHQRRCAACQRQTSVTAGTVFAGTRKPLQVWFLALWYASSPRLGGNALGLQRALGFGSYQTAWCWLHKLRRTIRPAPERLAGRVEIAVVALATLAPSKAGRKAQRTLVIIAVEIPAPRQVGRIKLCLVPSARPAHVVAFVQQAVQPGTVIVTDGWPGANTLSKVYVHEQVNRSMSPTPSPIVLPGVRRVADQLRRWLIAGHQSGVSHRHLGHYLAEFTFRFNQRPARSHGFLFYRLLQQAVQTDPVPYHNLVHPARRPVTQR